MEYLPTFTININQIHVVKYTSPMGDEQVKNHPWDFNEVDVWNESLTVQKSGDHQLIDSWSHYLNI